MYFDEKFYSRLEQLGAYVSILDRKALMQDRKSNGAKVYVHDLRGIDLSKPPGQQEGENLASWFQGFVDQFFNSSSDPLKKSGIIVSERRGGELLFENEGQRLFSLKNGLLQSSFSLSESNFKLTQQLAHILLFAIYGYENFWFNLRPSIFDNLSMADDLKETLVKWRSDYLSRKEGKAVSSEDILHEYEESEKLGAEKLEEMLAQENSERVVDIVRTNWFKNQREQNPFIVTGSVYNSAQDFCYIRYNSEMKGFEFFGDQRPENKDQYYMPGGMGVGLIIAKELIEEVYGVDLFYGKTKVAEKINQMSKDELKQSLKAAKSEHVQALAEMVEGEGNQSELLISSIMNYIEAQSLRPQDKTELLNDMIVGVVQQLTPDIYSQLMDMIKSSESISDRLNLADPRSCQQGCMNTKVYPATKAMFDNLKGILGEPPEVRRESFAEEGKFKFYPLEYLISCPFTEHDALAVMYALPMTLKELDEELTDDSILDVVGALVKVVKAVEKKSMKTRDMQLRRNVQSACTMVMSSLEHIANEAKFGPQEKGVFLTGMYSRMTLCNASLGEEEDGSPSCKKPSRS